MSVSLAHLLQVCQHQNMKKRLITCIHLLLGLKWDKKQLTFSRFRVQFNLTLWNLLLSESDPPGTEGSWRVKLAYLLHTQESLSTLHPPPSSLLICKCIHSLLTADFKLNCEEDGEDDVLSVRHQMILWPPFVTCFPCVTRVGGKNSLLKLTHIQGNPNCPTVNDTLNTIL